MSVTKRLKTRDRLAFTELNLISLLIHKVNAILYYFVCSKVPGISAIF